MTIETKNKVYGVIAVIALLLGVGSVAKAAMGGFLINVQNGTFNLNVPASIQVGNSQNEPTLGSAQTSATYLTDANTLSSQDSLQVWGTGTGQGLEVDGTSNFVGTVNARGALNVTGAISTGYASTLLNTPQVAFNGNSTTLCSVQNTSGVDRIISDLTLASTGSTGSGGVTGFRGYVSAARADMNTRATGTLFTASQLPIVVSLTQVWGGPVPNSYLVSSTPSATVGGLTTSTPAYWPNNWFANVTSTAITSSTGDCIISSYPL